MGYIETAGKLVIHTIIVHHIFSQRYSILRIAYICSMAEELYMRLDCPCFGASSPRHEHSGASQQSTLSSFLLILFSVRLGIVRVGVYPEAAICVRKLLREGLTGGYKHVGKNVFSY